MTSIFMITICYMELKETVLLIFLTMPVVQFELFKIEFFFFYYNIMRRLFIKTV